MIQSITIFCKQLTWACDTILSNNTVSLGKKVDKSIQNFQSSQRLQLEHIFSSKGRKNHLNSYSLYVLLK